MSEAESDLNKRREVLMISLFSDLQSARMNYLYYQRRSDRSRKFALCANVVSALAGSAVLAGLVSNNIPGGATAWLGVTGLSVVAAAVGPVFGWEKSAEKQAKAAFGFSLVHDRIKGLLRDLKLSELTSDHEARSIEITKLREALSALEDEAPDTSALQKSLDEACESYPSNEKAWNAI